MNNQGLKLWRKIPAILFWVILWQLLTMIIDNNIILVGPADTALALARLVPTVEFWRCVASSFGKISVGFLSAFISGLLLGSAGYRYPLLCDLLDPVMTLMKSVPVASFVILALIWAGSKNLSILIAFLVVLPMIYVNTLAGLKSTDRKLLEMARVFHMKPFRRVRYIYLPSLLPYLISGLKVALGMSWKSGIAAEVIGVPSHSIGENLYMAKIYLDTENLFAWTVTVIAVSAAFETIALRLLSKLDRSKGGAHEPADS